MDQIWVMIDFPNQKDEMTKFKGVEFLTIQTAGSAPKPNLALVNLLMWRGGGLMEGFYLYYHVILLY